MRKQVSLINWRVIDALKNCSLALVCCVWAAVIAPSQSISGRITGVITDQAGAVIRNASVSVTNEGTGAQRRATVDENGLYVAPELPVGFYTIKVEGGGFAPATRTRVKVDVGAVTRVNVTLTLQATELSVNVRAEASLPRPDSSALAEVVNNKQVDALPIDGRDYRRLTTLAPGAAPRSPRGSLGSFTVNGQREKANIFLIDGVDNNDSFRNQPSFIDYLETSANSNYNALQATLNQRLSRGMNFYVAYTWSKSIDDASNGIYGGSRGVSFPQDSYNLRAERAVSSFDVRHRFSANFTYDLDFLSRGLSHWPKRLTEGWQLGGIYTGSSGLPITPFLSADVSGTGELNDRPNLVADPNSGSPRGATQWFNKAAFTRPADGTFGSSERNTIIGPSLHMNKYLKLKPEE